MSPGLCSKRSAAAAPPVVIHRRDADVYGEKRRREEAERRARAGARGPGPPPRPRAVAAPLRRRIVRCLPRRRPRRAPLLRRRGGERRRERERERGARRHMELRGAGGRRLRRPRNAVPRRPYAVTARQPHRGTPSAVSGGGRHGPTHRPVLGEPRGRRPGGVRVFCGTGRDAAQRWGQCGTRGQCAEMGTVRNMGTACRDGHPEPRSPARCQGCPPREGRAVRVRTEPSVPSLCAASHAPQPRCAVAPCRRRAQLRL